MSCSGLNRGTATRPVEEPAGQRRTDPDNFRPYSPGSSADNDVSERSARVGAAAYAMNPPPSVAPVAKTVRNSVGWPTVHHRMTRLQNSMGTKGRSRPTARATAPITRNTLGNREVDAARSRTTPPTIRIPAETYNPCFDAQRSHGCCEQTEDECCYRHVIPPACGPTLDN